MERTESEAITGGCCTAPLGAVQEGHDSADRCHGSFSPADAAAAFGAGFLDEAVCRSWVLRQLHPSGGHCPGCGLPVVDDTTINNFWAGKRCACQHCGRWFTAVSETFLQGMHMNFSQVFLLTAFADYLSTGLTIPRVATALDISPETVRIWRRRFKAIENGPEDIENEL